MLLSIQYESEPSRVRPNGNGRDDTACSYPLPWQNVVHTSLRNGSTIHPSSCLGKLFWLPSLYYQSTAVLYPSIRFASKKKKQACVTVDCLLLSTIITLTSDDNDDYDPRSTVTRRTATPAIDSRNTLPATMSDSGPANHGSHGNGSR